jgi:hypothetical protein
MNLIQENIKLYTICSANGHRINSIGNNEKSYVIDTSLPHLSGLSINGTIEKEECTEQITVTMNSQILLTDDNLLLIDNWRVVIDLKERKMYSYNETEFNALKPSNKRKQILLNNA